MNSKLLILLVLFVGLMLSGCQTTTTYYLGAKADGESIISLVPVQTGQHQWQDLYVTVDFDLQQRGHNLELDGVLSFSDSPKGNFTGVRDLKLKLFLLNQDMRVVEYFDVARTLSRNLDDETTFSQTVRREASAVAMTFGYEGSFVDNDPEGFSSQTVWKLPKRSSQ